VPSTETNVCADDSLLNGAGNSVTRIDPATAEPPAAIRNRRTKGPRLSGAFVDP
jgi:hypothetical protein